MKSLEVKRSNDLILIIALSLIGLILRVFFVQSIQISESINTNTFVKIVDNINANQGFNVISYIHSMNGVAYVTILSFFSKLFTSSTVLTALRMNALMSTMLIPLVYYTLTKLTVKRNVLLMSTIIVTFLPHNILSCRVIGPEIMASLFLIIFVAIQVREFNYLFKYALLSIVIVMMFYTSYLFLAYPIVMFLIEWINFKDFKIIFKKILIMPFIIVLACVAILIIKNVGNDNVMTVTEHAANKLLFNNNSSIVEGDTEESENQFILTFTLENDKVDANTHQLYRENIYQNWLKKNPIKFLELGAIRIHETYFSGVSETQEVEIDKYINNVLNVHEKHERNRLTQFIKSFSEIVSFLLSSIGIVFMIIHFGSILSSIRLRQSNLDPIVSVVYLNFMYFIFMIFVFEGNFQFSIITLTLLSIILSVVICGYSRPMESYQ